jgi:hypothetical protein
MTCFKSAPGDKAPGKWGNCAQANHLSRRVGMDRIKGTYGIVERLFFVCVPSVNWAIGYVE